MDLFAVSRSALLLVFLALDAADVLLVRGLGAASVGSLVCFDDGQKPRARLSCDEETHTAASHVPTPAFNVGVVLQLLDQELTIVGLLGRCGDATLSGGFPLSPSSASPLVGDICTLVGGGARNVSETGDADTPHTRLAQLPDTPLSPLSLLSSLSSPEKNAIPSCVSSDTWNVFSLPTRGAFPSSQSCTPAVLHTGSTVLDSLSPFRLGSSTAVVGPLGTGKSTSLLPLIASHLVSSSASLGASASSVEAETAHSTPPSVVFLSLGTSPPSALAQWLDTLRSVAIPSAAASSPRATTASEATGASQGWGGERKQRLKSKAAANRRDETESFGPNVEGDTPSRRNAESQNSIPPGVLFLHVPPDTHSTSCCMYTAPMLALKAAMASQAAGQNVLLVIDGMDAHAAAAAQLKQNLGQLLASSCARAVLPASGSRGGNQPRGGWGVHTPGGRVSLGGQGSCLTDGGDSGTLPVLPFASIGSYYGQLTSQAGTGGEEGKASLSLVCVLDTPPGVCTPGSSAASGAGADMTKQEKQWNRVISSAIQGDSSLGETTLRKVVEAAQEVLISSADKTVVFHPDAQLDRQSKDQLNKDRMYQWRRSQGAWAEGRSSQNEESLLRSSSGGKRKSMGGVGSVYPMVDLDFLLASSPALLSADACAALSASCFSPSFQENPPPPELLSDALKDLCRKHAEAARHPENACAGFETSPLLSAAASAFAWQQKVLRSQRERQEMMAALKLFVDIWEEEDLVSLHIASSVCTAQLPGRVFSSAEQVLLLRAAATLLFSPVSDDAGVPAPSAPAGPASYKLPWFVGQDRNRVSFADVCGFQESLLGLFQERHPTVWQRLVAYLARDGAHQGPMPAETHARLGASQGANLVLQDETQEAELDKQVTELLQLIGEIDRGLLALGRLLPLTSPPAEE
ncbi:putative signal recognition particle domain-containing protein [Neospora caninum Liverpool]|uniref:Putative signal recognition particle domain-containing protein n=1 Tax=Neospora caninum (strain Liverpool) TaxID=572307 RepID=F0VKL5_NEOCL|nr:putative signal recognition particle domain-containing protein [Neospora caninum Liverpool]CBZ54616.1 putative signal recognition particle domain-containing protein [Neospora caninum Liverpool]|eukprot:XP_003884646.1 putative signal recognition particle domain-containing protein [Neospora caninum Liverpool]